MVSHQRRGAQKSGRMKWLVLGLCMATCVLFRKSLLLVGVKVALSSAVAGGPGVEWGYEQIRWDGDLLKITGFQWKRGQRQVLIDSSEIHLEMDWRHAKMLAQVSIEHPHIVLETGAESDAALPFLPALFSHPRLSIRWEMQHGVLQFPASLPVSRLFFSFAGGDGAEQLGALTLSYEPQVSAKPLLTASFVAEEGKLGYRFDVCECDCGHIVPLIPFLSSDPSLHWKDAEGTIAIEGHGVVDSRFDCVDFQCKVTGKGLKLSSGQKEKKLFGVEHLEAEVNYHPSGEKRQFWEELIAHIDAQEGYWKAVEEDGRSIFALEQTNLKCVLSSTIDPEIQMDGTVVQEERREPFHLLGKGKVQLDGRYWVQAHVVMGSEKHGVEGVISLCQSEQDQHVLHVELERADSDYVNGIAQMVSKKPLTYRGESLQGKLFFEFSRGSWTRFTLDEIVAEGIGFDMEGKAFSAEGLGCSADVRKLNDGGWWIEKGVVNLHQGQWLQRDIHVSHLEGELSIIDNELQPTVLTAQLGKMQGEIQVHGTQAERLLDAHWEGDLSSIFVGDAAPLPVCRVDGTLKKNGLGWDCIGKCAIGEEVIHWGLQAKGPTSLTEIGVQGAAWTIAEGWIRSEKLTELSFAPFAERFLGGADLRGEIDIVGTFRDSQWSCCIQGNNLHLEHPLFTLMIDQLGKTDSPLGRALFSYNVATGNLVGELPLQKGKLVYKNSAFSLQHVNGNLQIKDALVSNAQKNAMIHELIVGGKLSDIHIPISDQTYFSHVSCTLHYNVHRGEITVKNGQGSWMLADGSSYQVELDHLQFNPQRSVEFDIKILDVGYEIGRLNGQLTQNTSLGWDLELDRNATHFYGTKLQVGKLVFRDDGSLLFFEMHSLVNIKDLQKQLKFILSSGLFASGELDHRDLEELQLAGQLQTEVKWEDQVLHFKAQSHNLLLKGNKIGDFKLIGKKEGERWIIDHLQADSFQTKAIVNIEGKTLLFSHVDGVWDNLVWKGSCVYSHSDKKVAVQIDSLQGDLDPLRRWISPIDPTWKGAFGLKARAEWELLTQTISGECAAIVDLLSPLSVRIRQDTPLSFRYVVDQGLEVKGLEPKLFEKDSLQHLGSLSADGVFQKDQWDLHHLQFSLSPQCIQKGIDARLLSQDFRGVYYESYLEGKGDLHSSFQKLLFQGSLRSGRYGINQSIYPLENIQIHYENACLQCRFKTLLNQRSLWGTLSLDLNGAPCGTLQLSDQIHLKGIEAIFHANGTHLYWDRIEGAACGIDVQLQAKQGPSQANAMEGMIRIDGSRLDAFLPKEMQEKFKNLKLGKGYAFQGDLILWHDSKRGFELNGQLLGNQFELLGYQLDHLRAQIVATPQHIQISKLAIEDEAGLFELKKIAIHHTPFDQKWSFHIPLLQIKDLQPSVMKKLSDKTATIKPLVIRNLSLSEIRGDLNDVRGWTGEGHLNFTNVFKKESTLFDTPIQMIKNLGLDPGLLTPVQGEIDLELRGDKFYLVNMKNAFSNGKRSQFFLSAADQTSYIDLNGNIHIDIMMRQDVVLKLTEAFTLIVRGTLDKPRYGLR